MGPDENLFPARHPRTGAVTSKGGDISEVSTTSLNRLCGLALMAALPLFLAGEFIHPPSEEIRYLVLPTYPIAHALDLAAFLLLLLAVPGLYARQAGRAGRLGLAGFILTMLFLAGSGELLLWEAFGAPRLAADPATSYLVVSVPPGHAALAGATGMMANGALGAIGRYGALTALTVLGPILFGVATWRARVYPRWVGILQIGSILFIPLFLLIQAGLGRLGFFNADLSVIGLGYGTALLGYAWGGLTLWREGKSVESSAASATESMAPAVGA
jgi:hypothetical protein